MTSDLFLDVLKHFVKFANASLDNPALLILDNHESHLSINVIDYAQQNGVTMLTIHPHCSHKLQPLDVSVYGPFKAYFSGAMKARLDQKPGGPVTIYDVAALVGIAHQKAMVPSNIISGFRKTGIFPFNRDIFQDHDFAPSFVTDRPFMNSVRSSGSQTDQLIIEMQSPPRPLNDKAEHPSRTPTADPSGKSFLSPEQIRGYPKAGERKTTQRNVRKRRSMILTDDLEKESLAKPSVESQKSKKCKKSKKQLHISDSEDNADSDSPAILSDHSSDNTDEELEDEVVFTEVIQQVNILATSVLLNLIPPPKNIMSER